ncbi:MAG TPA: plastocyanin/azurin family copper-binding protein [Solirubrobacteraceae bacterium]|nr:plastocyanin/azurin family copper-binding protein [Solirubrobacteraceae bacterium]
MRRALATLGAVAALTPPAAAAQEHHGHAPAGAAPSGRVGLLLADHGEPPVYDETTYWSFRDFVAGLMDSGVIPPYLRHVDTGTITHEHHGAYVDAWLRPHDGPAVPVPGSDDVGAHHVLAGGPGLREPDVFEHAGLQTWQEYRLMGGRSPNHDEKLPRTEALLASLRTRYGARLPVRVGHMIDPRIGGGRQGIEQAVEALVRRDRVDSLVVAYMGVGFSDIMQTHHLRHHLHRALAALGVPDMPVRYAEPLGTTREYADAIVAKVQRELDAVPAGEPVAVHLSGHGLPTARCGEYDCGADAYHRSSAALFERVRARLRARIRRGGRWDVFHLYGEGADDENDPGDEVDSPLEALEKRRHAGFRHVVDVPHEFDANSRDTLVVLRRGYGRTPPDWDAALESRFAWSGLHVKLASASGGDRHKIAARERVVEEALRGLVEPLPAAGRATIGVHDDHFHPAAVTIRRGGTVTWRWLSHHPHDLRFRRDAARRAPARTSGRVRRRFPRAGTYRFRCTLHAGMRGKVVVR